MSLTTMAEANTIHPHLPETPSHDCNEPALRVSRTYLAHALLAQHSPELRTLDQVITIRSRRAPITARPSIFSLPVEILLAIRAQLHPMVTSALLNDSAHGLTAALLGRTRGFCAECLKYNVHVFGSDVLAWPDHAGAGTETDPLSMAPAADEKKAGCLCGVWEMDGKVVETSWRREERERERESVKALVSTDFFSLSSSETAEDGRDSSLKPCAPEERQIEHPHGSPASDLNDFAFDTAYSPQAWLDAHLSRMMPHQKPIWPTVTDIVSNEFGCSMICPDQDAKGNMVSDDILIIPTDPHHQFALMRLAREFSLPMTYSGTGPQLIAAARSTAATYLAERVKCIPPRTKDMVSFEQPKAGMARKLGMAVGFGVCAWVVLGLGAF
ncbi:hypothetical protein DENSPDRAFT_350922 [Dentipellis sp. KUC8613]|nr:hypothetical protein DENSPDRAFT_350922 [Dentipellis sp. KUC8613]